MGGAGYASKKDAFDSCQTTNIGEAKGLSTSRGSAQVASPRDLDTALDAATTSCNMQLHLPCSKSRVLNLLSLEKPGRLSKDAAQPHVPWLPFLPA